MLLSQVTSTCIALVTDGQQVQEVHIDSNFPVVQAAIVDPYVALLTQNGRMLLYELVMEPYVHLREVDMSASMFAKTSSNASQLTSISIYADASEIMTCCEKKSVSEKQTDKANTDSKKDVDDDFLLYGEDDDYLYGDTAGCSMEVDDVLRMRSLLLTMTNNTELVEFRWRHYQSCFERQKKETLGP